ncbi:MAG: paraquat-inducible protein A [Akkermansiaceae bacterium]
MSSDHQQTWPRLSGERHRVICHFCDTVHEVPLLEEGRAAHCSNCGALMYRNQANSLHRSVAFGVTAMSLLILTMIFPFISVSTGGSKTVMTVPGAIAMLWNTGGQFIALCVSLFVIVLPFALISTLLYICVPLIFGKALPGCRLLTRGIFTIQPWVMVEVFFLGAIVSLLKLVSLAEVSLGIGFWAVSGLMLCMAGAVSGIDRMELWDRIEVARHKALATTVS